LNLPASTVRTHDIGGTAKASEFARAIIEAFSARTTGAN
jgi:hypothetical protein